MIFYQDNIVFQILNVLSFDLGPSKVCNINRHCDAIAFRYETDAIIGHNNKKIKLTDNSIGYFPANIKYTKNSTKEKFIVIHFNAFNYWSNKIEVFSPTDYEKYQVLFEEIYKCWNNKDVGYRHKASALFNILFSQLYAENISSHNKSEIDSSIEYIEENFLKKDFSIQDAAEKSSVSTPVFRKIFKEKFSVLPKQYVVYRRIKYATVLLSTGKYSLKEIAYMCGYINYKHFSVEFKKVLGQSPSQYTYPFMHIYPFEDIY